MTALAASRMSSKETWKYRRFPLASGNVAYKGGLAAIDLSTGKVEPGHAETDLFVIGTFAEDKDATSAEKQVNVELAREVNIEWLENGSSIAATDVGSLCYIADDQTVTTTPTGASVAGRIWGVETARGVAVELLQPVPSPNASLSGLNGVDGDATAFASNDSVIPNNPTAGTIFDIPTTAAASTVTLPATAVEGTVIYFVADGTKNGHTVQYRDATGPVNLTTALTASKRHQVTAIFLNSKWTAAAYVAP